MRKAVRAACITTASVIIGCGNAIAGPAPYEDYRAYGEYQGGYCRKPSHAGFPNLAKEGWFICPRSSNDGKRVVAMWIISPERKMVVYAKLKQCDKPVEFALAGSSKDQNHQKLINYGSNPSFKNPDTKKYYFNVAMQAAYFLQYDNGCSPLTGQTKIVGDYSNLQKGFIGFTYPSPWASTNVHPVGVPLSRKGCSEFWFASRRTFEGNNPCIPVLED